MCGIVAVIGSREAAPLLLDGLRQLEYRGYDSAGIATVNAERQLSCLRAEGKLVNLSQRFEAAGAPGHCGIGHTRWATHGKPEERNAHPHLDGPGRVAVVLAELPGALLITSTHRIFCWKHSRFTPTRSTRSGDENRAG